MISSKLLFISGLWGAIAGYLAYRTAYSPFGSLESMIYGTPAFTSACLSLFSLWILTLRPSPHRGVLSVLHQLYFAGMSYIRGRYHLRGLKEGWRNPRRAQERFLRRILEENGDTDYGRKLKLKNITSMDDFRKSHPLTTYDDYKPYVERVMAGERGVMTQVMPNAFIQTSGTTGPSKYFPQRDHRHSLRRMLDIIYSNLHHLCPRLGLLQKKLFHYVQPIMTRTKGGGSVRPAVSVYEEDGFTEACHTTPPAGFCIQSFNQANYIHLLFGLLDRNLGAIGSLFIGGIDAMMKQLEQSWEEIVCDIESGTINENVKFTDDGIKSSLERALGNGHPERAGELRRQFMKGFDKSIIRRVWPNLEVIFSIDSTGIWPQFKTKYAEDIPLVNFGYGNSEGMFLAHSPWFHEDNRSMVPFPNFAFFEFIRLEDAKENQPRTFLIDELEIGKEYEIVFTQDSGLYRYRVGDVIRITGYHYNCPTFEFMYRMGLMLNLRYEKMNQVVLKEGLQSAVGQFNCIRLVDYAVAESTIIPASSSAFEGGEDMPYYVMFLELRQEEQMRENKQSEFVDAEQIKTTIDNELRARNSDYHRLRREGSISHPRIYLMKHGTFDDLKQYVVTTTNTTANQYKVPRRIRTLDTFNFMYDHVC
ncbi:indole-3-acetic acid-amido synthetase GH3.3-like [Lytechinus variegatus]|uniref:indole-3-acetic acid-amido synthetase GH3.3-like n=1 Tax=Lytechinus variegatus TaxID=7654 RepID=UPI001BB1BCFE|nr:indole-3-acetic acid-amido synthetase GH3.3-like [Lytechinus variegatus]